MNDRDMNDRPDWYQYATYPSAKGQDRPWKWAFGDYVAVVILVGFVLNHIF